MLLSSTVTILALLLTALLAAAVFDRSDAAGHALAEVWALAAAAALWLLLAGLCLLCGWRAGFRGAERWLLPAVFLLAAAAQPALLALVSYRQPPRLLFMAALIAAPLLVLARTSWSLFPWATRWASNRTIDLWTIGPLLLLALLPWVPLRLRTQRVARARAQAPADDTAARSQMDSVQARSLAEVRAFKPDTPLSRVILYTGSPSPQIRDEARARARLLTARQAQAEQLLADGDERVLRALPHLDLAPSEAICSGARGILARRAADWLPAAPDPTRAWFDEIEWQVAPLQDSIAWLLSQGCQCGPELQRLKQVVQQSKSTAASRGFAAWLEALENGRKAQ